MEPTVNDLETPQSCLAYTVPPATPPSATESRLAWAVLHALLEQLPVGVVVANAHGPVRVVHENEVAQRIRLSDGAKAEWPMARALLLGEVVRDEEINVAMSDGTRRWLSVSATPIRLGGDLVEAAVVTFVDVTAVKQADAWRPVVESLYRL